MPTLTIHKMPPALHDRLLDSASLHERNLEQEIVARLETAFNESYEIPPTLPFKGGFSITQNWLDQAVEKGRE